MTDVPEPSGKASPESGDDGAPPSSSHTKVLQGIAGSPGLSVGRAVVVDTRRPGIPRRHIKRADVAPELARYEQATTRAAAGLREVAGRVGGGGGAEASILEAYIMMVEDPTLRGLVEAGVGDERKCVEWSLDSAVEKLASQLRAAGDPYLQERSHDVEFVGERILRELSGRPRALNLLVMNEPCVIVAHDLSPAETAGLSKDRVKALVTEVGTRTNHTAILARALDIPAVVGAGEVLSQVATGDLLVVDGLRGTVTLEPSPEAVEAAEQRAERYATATRSLRASATHESRTKDGVSVAFRANIELPAEADIAKAEGAEGIGLYRTEFLFADENKPTEQRQYDVYRQVIETVRPNPVTLRTFDIGGDKFVSAFPVAPELNPALGLRAVRLALAQPETFMAQLRAMVRASAHGPLQIMVPMVATLGELRAVREMLDMAIRQIDAEGAPRAESIPLGIMVEVPAAAVLSADLAREAEFLSIGTNDLVQYTLAVDRGNHDLAYLASPLNPAILKLIAMVVEAGKLRQRPVSVCGAMASDPLAALLLVGMGLRQLSVEASVLTVLRACLSRVDLESLQETAFEALACQTKEEVDQLLRDRWGPLLTDILDLD